jgi:hypothetical protein
VKRHGGENITAKIDRIQSGLQSVEDYFRGLNIPEIEAREYPLLERLKATLV